jgi:hypothetical protein
MKFAKHAVNRLRARTFVRQIRQRPFDYSPSRVAPAPARSGLQVPPLCICNSVSACERPGSTDGGHFSDESFWLCDVQFNVPTIRVESSLLSEESRNFRGT